MVKFFAFLFFTFFLFSCDNYTSYNSCFENTIATVSLDTNNPGLLGVLTPTGYAEVNGGLQGIILYNGATLGYKAFDRKCPNFDCDTPMSFNGFSLKCDCDGSEYSILTGEPLPQGTEGCFAREYSVSENGSSIRISN